LPPASLVDCQWDSKWKIGKITCQNSDFDVWVFGEASGDTETSRAASHNDVIIFMLKKIVQ
jgi:hypothetical protein